VETIRFIFWLVMKTLGLAFVGLLTAKAIAGLRSEYPSGDSRLWRWSRGVLYGAALVLVILGARSLGFDAAAEVYASASGKNLEHAQLDKAYNNALRAVQMRPKVLRYWRQLAASKLALHQCDSLLLDRPAFEALSGGGLADEDGYPFAACHFFLGDYDKAILLTQQSVERNQIFAPPYVLQGAAYTAQRKYREAEKDFLHVLQLFPTHQLAVEGLAHTYYLAGNRVGAVGVLNETKQYPFSPQARQRFEALKALYAQ
jgi:tetratricopeptide (TPR) repeat protein